jgi:hypothetical protein
MIAHRGAPAFEGLSYFGKNILQQWLEMYFQLFSSIMASPNSKA